MRARRVFSEHGTGPGEGGWSELERVASSTLARLASALDSTSFIDRGAILRSVLMTAHWSYDVLIRNEQLRVANDW